jgi:hypothetical protein
MAIRRFELRTNPKPDALLQYRREASDDSSPNQVAASNDWLPEIAAVGIQA